MSTATAYPRTPSPTALLGRGTAHALLTQVRSEVVRYRRMPEYFIGVVVLPIILFAMFGLPAAGTRLPDGTTVTALLFVSFSCYGVISQALFSFGAELATERQKGWLRRLRATPMPMWLYFTGKLALNIVFILAIIVGMAALAATAGAANFDPAALMATMGVLVLGTVAFSPMGAAIAYWVRPKAATTIVNLVFLPLAFLSGFFFSLSSLPQILQDIAPYLPTYHFGQLAWATMAASEADRLAFGLPPATDLTLSAVIVIGWFLLCSTLTALGYRRELERERG
jgi:ABC-2 type transport system permease protein